MSAEKRGVATVGLHRCDGWYLTPHAGRLPRVPFFRHPPGRRVPYSCHHLGRRAAFFCRHDDHRVHGPDRVYHRAGDFATHLPPRPTGAVRLAPPSVWVNGKSSFRSAR